MPTRFRIPVLTAVCILFLASCTKTNKQGRFIPKDAAVAVHVDGAALSAKLPWEEVKQNALFKEMYADTTIPVFVKKALDNSDNSGIDTKNDLLFFAQKDSVGGIVAFTGTIKDAEKFKLFMLDFTEGGSPSENEGVSFISRSPMCVGWNKERFLLIVNAPKLGAANFMGRQGTNDYSPKARDLLATCTNVFNLKESNSLGENEKFTALVKKTGDIHFWINNEEFSKNSGANFTLSMTNINKLYEGSRTAVAVNFENGKILVDIKSYAGKELSELYKKYSGKNIDEEMIKRLPVKDVGAVFAMSFKPEGIKEFLKLLGVEGYANMGLAFAGFSLDDFIKANKGDLLIALTDLKQKEMNDSAVKMNTDTVTNFKNPYFEPNILFATSIGDKDAFNQLIKAGDKLGKNLPTSIPISYNSDAKYFAISNSKENIDGYFSGKNSTIPDYLNKINGNPFGAYVNMQFILKAIARIVAKDSTSKAIYDTQVKMWDNAYIKGGNYEDGGLTQSIEINLMDKNTSSLKQLNQYLGTLGQLMQEKKKQHEAMDALDDVQAVPPPGALIDTAKKSK